MLTLSLFEMLEIGGEMRAICYGTKLSKYHRRLSAVIDHHGAGHSRWK